MKRCKNGQIIFDSTLDLTQEINRRVQPLIDKEIEKYHANLEQAKIEATKEALILLLPIACTSLYEAYGFGEVRQQKFIDYFVKHMECVNMGVTDLEQYREFCVEQGLKYFEMEEVE